MEWKREQGRECKTCPNVIAKWYWQTSKDQLEERLGKSPEEQLKFANRVQTWEAEKNLGKRSWNHEKFEKRRPQDTSVFVDRTDEVRTEEHLGYLWPIAVYKREKGDKPSRKQLTTVEHAGKPVRGVVMNTMVIGAIKVTALSRAGVTKRSVVANNDEMSESELEDMFKTAQRKRRVTAKTRNDEEGNPAFTIKTHPSKKRLALGSDSEEDLLDQMWGQQFKASRPSRGCSSGDDGRDGRGDCAGDRADHRDADAESACGGAGGGGGGGGGGGEDDSETVSGTVHGTISRRRPQRTGAGAASGTSSSAPLGPGEASSASSAVPAGGSPAPPPSAEKRKEFSAVRVNKELDNSDAVLMQATQLQNMLGDIKLVTGISVKQVDTLVGKLEARLKPDLVRLYSSDFDPGQLGTETSRGMKVLTALNEAQAKLSVIQAFAVSLCAQKPQKSTPLCVASPSPWSPATLKATYIAVKNSGMKITDKCLKFVVVRALTDALEDEDWYCYSKLLLWKVDESAEETEKLDGSSLGVSQLDEADARDIQNTLPIQHVLEMVRPAANMDKDIISGKLLGFLRALVSANVWLCADMMGYFTDLLTIAMPDDHMENDALKLSKLAITTEPKHVFHKMMFFPTIASWVQNCSNILKQMEVDACYTVQLPPIDELANNLLAAEAEAIVTANITAARVPELNIVNATEWESLLTKVAQVKANASEHFLKKAALTFGRVDEAHNHLAKRLAEASDHIAVMTLRPHCDLMKAILTSVAKAVPAAKARALKAGLEGFEGLVLPSAEDLKLPKMLPPEQIREYSKWSAHLQSFSADIKVSFPIVVQMLGKQVVDVNNQALMSLFAHCCNDADDAMLERLELKAVGPLLKTAIQIYCLAQLTSKVTSTSINFLKHLEEDSTKEALDETISILGGENFQEQPVLDRELAAFMDSVRKYLNPRHLPTVKMHEEEVNTEMLLALPMLLYLVRSIQSLQAVMGSSDANLETVLHAMDVQVAYVMAAHGEATAWMSPTHCDQGGRLASQLEALLARAALCVAQYLKQLCQLWADAMQASMKKMKASIAIETFARLDEKIEAADLNNKQSTEELLEVSTCENSGELFAAYKTYKDMKNLPSYLATPLQQGDLDKPAFKDSVSYEIAAMEQFIADTCEEARAPKEILANLTIIQALYRPTGAGELRRNLALRCREGLRKKELTLQHAKLTAALAVHCGDAAV